MVPGDGERETAWRYPTLEEAGVAGGFYLVGEPYWLKRHVESLIVLDDESARRRLTVDLVLPEQEEVILQRHGPQAVYYVPVALMAKDRPTNFVDLRDEEGRALPLLTRRDNGVISALALVNAAERLAKRSIGPDTTQILQGIAREGLRVAEVYLALLQLSIEKKESELRTDSLHWPRFYRVLHDLAGNTLLWTPFVGSPGERRIVKFAYNVAWTHPASRRIKVMTGLGWYAIKFRVEWPAMVDADSYHLQVHAPEGMDAQSIGLSDPLPPEELEALPVPIVQSGSASLHMAAARATSRPPVIVPLRVPVGVIGMLVLFAARPGEHPLVTRVLLGVRLTVIGSGLLAGAAAAALAGVRPSAWGLGEAWDWYARASLLPVAILGVSYLSSLPRPAVVSAPTGVQVLKALLATSCVAAGLLQLVRSNLEWVASNRVWAALGLGAVAAMAGGISALGARAERGAQRRAGIAWSITLCALLTGGVLVLSNAWPGEPRLSAALRDIMHGGLALALGSLVALLALRGGESERVLDE